MFVILIGIITLAVSAAGLNLAWRKYMREHEYNAVLTGESAASFNKAINYCEPVIINLINLSKYPVIIRVDVYAEGFWLHADNGDSHENCHQSLRLPEWTIAPNNNYLYNLRIHTESPLPATANVSLYVNGAFWCRFAYNLDANSQYYWLAQ